MSVWVLHQLLSPEEEAAVEKRERLVLPFDGVPDLSTIETQAELHKMLSALHPELPPESIARTAERHWSRFQNLHADDLVAVPLHARREIALATLSGRYHYEVGPNGEDVHLMNVTWYPVRIPLVKLGKHKPVFENYGERLFEITDIDVRNALRTRLPHSYNRFARWKWVLVFLFIIQMIAMLSH